MLNIRVNVVALNMFAFSTTAAPLTEPTHVLLLCVFIITKYLYFCQYRCKLDIEFILYLLILEIYCFS